MDSQISEFLAKHGTAGKTYNFAFDHSSSFEEIIYGELDAEESGEELELNWLEYTDSPEDYTFDLYREDGGVRIWVEAVDGLIKDRDMCNGIMYGLVAPAMPVIEVMESTYAPADDSLTIKDVKKVLLSLGLRR